MPRLPISVALLAPGGPVHHVTVNSGRARLVAPFLQPILKPLLGEQAPEPFGDWVVGVDKARRPCRFPTLALDDWLAAVRVGANLAESDRVEVRDAPQAAALLADGVLLDARVDVELVSDRLERADDLVVELEERSDDIGEEGKNEVDRVDGDEAVDYEPDEKDVKEEDDHVALQRSSKSGNRNLSYI